MIWAKVIFLGYILGGTAVASWQMDRMEEGDPEKFYDNGWWNLLGAFTIALIYGPLWAYQIWQKVLGDGR